MDTQRGAGFKVPCSRCGRKFPTATGVSVHKRYCDKAAEEAERNRVYEEAWKASQIQKSQAKATAAPTRKPAAKAQMPWEKIGAQKRTERPIFLGVPADTPNPATSSIQPDLIPGPAPSRSRSQTPSRLSHQIDDIRTMYHPHSNRPTTSVAFEDYQSYTKASPPPVPPEPWRPFQSKTDFEFAEFALDASLNKRQVEQLIHLVKRCINKEDTFNIDSHKSLCETWDRASKILTPVHNISLTTLYN